MGRWVYVQMDGQTGKRIETESSQDVSGAWKNEEAAPKC